MGIFSGYEDPEAKPSEYPYSPMLGIGIIFWVLLVYLGLRQAGHILGLLLSGTSGGLGLLLVNTQDLVKTGMDLNNLQISLRSLGGMLAPLLVWAGFMLLAPRRGTSALETLKLVSTVAALGSLIGWIFIPLGYTASKAASEDVALFMSASGLNGLLMGGLCALLFVGSYLLARRRISYPGALRDLLQGKANDLDYPSNRWFYLCTTAILTLIIVASLIVRLLRN